MDLTLLIVLGFVVWFALGIGCGYSYRSTYRHTGTAGYPTEGPGAVFPVSWIPPFMRNDWVVEEVVQGKEIYRGPCPRDLTGFFEYMDKRMKKTIIVEFRSGTVVAMVA